MFGMSVNEVPGWLVAMAPSGIGVPVAATPGLVPQLDVLTVAALAELDELPAGVVDDPVRGAAAATATAAGRGQGESGGEQDRSSRRDMSSHLSPSGR